MDRTGYSSIRWPLHHSQQLRDKGSFVQYSQWASPGTGEFTGGINAEKLEDGEGQIGRTDGPFDRQFTQRIRGPDHAATLHTATGQTRKARARPMVAAAERVKLGRAAKLAQQHYEGGIQ